jgi:ADP-ribose pyrophosphatase YjhB (NUDIX family)
MEKTDTDPISAAMRELKEETGYVSMKPRLIASLTVDPAKLSNRLHLVLAEGAEPIGTQQLDDAESLEIVLMPADQLFRCALNGSVINAAHVGLITMGLTAAGLLNWVPSGLSPLGPQRSQNRRPPSSHGV